jgi:multicomponent Na+:H+ antiporter subunit D
VAAFQNDLKRLLAYSSVGQIGYITLGLAIDTPTGLTATLVHLVNHAVAKGALFMLAGAAALALGASSFERLAGVGRSMPLTAFGIVLGGLSLIGVPGTAGFVSKWYLVLAALEQDRWWLVAAIVASSLIAVAYVWRFVETAYFREPPADATRATEAGPGLLVPAGLLLAATLWFGIDTSFTVGSASAAAAFLFGAGP